jgi:sugar fermentation stimulation protein A
MNTPMLMPPLDEGILIQRVKRFLANIRLNTGQVITAHCPNSGSMLSCNEPGNPVLVSQSENPERLYRYTWEMIFCNNSWVGINTMVPNKVVFEAISQKKIPGLDQYQSIKREVRYGQNSRIDLLLSSENELCYVEIKNVSLVQDGIAYFPDSVTTRGTKHLRELINVKQNGHRAIMFFFIQRSDYTLFRPAAHIDPEYAQTLQQAVAEGVEVMVYQASVSPQEINIEKPIPFELSK